MNKIPNLPVNPERSRMIKAIGMGIILTLFFTPTSSPGQHPEILTIGDSLGEGVQSADANLSSQKHSYAAYVSKQMGLPLAIPWIKRTPAGVVGDTFLRSRTRPDEAASNLSVSGADVHAVLYDHADASAEDEIDSELDLVNFPRTGSQIEIVESLRPSYTLCWIGNNDVLSAVTSFDQLDGSQMTPVNQFEADFKEIARRLGAMGGKVVFANIPDVTRIGFLVDRHDLLNFLGSDFGLSEGDFTSVVVMLLIRLGLDDGSLLDDPRFILDAGEVRRIQERVDIFNIIINDAAANIQMPVVDIHALLEDILKNPPSFFGTEITPRFLGGILSLDGVHLSNIGAAIAANAFIRTINTHFNSDFPQISEMEMMLIFLGDPFQDKDGDGSVRGRFGAGFLETLGPFLGISGDIDEFIPTALPTLFNVDQKKAFIEQFLILQGKNPQKASEWNRWSGIEAFRYILGL